jgi:hypothetical protein
MPLRKKTYEIFNKFPLAVTENKQQAGPNPACGNSRRRYPHVYGA